MSYQVLARKWRPQKFRDVVGQEHITTTLKNAIRKDRVGHAYLFVGPRGIGKTTTARIFAKALNCTNLAAGAGDDLEPCGECDTCREIAAGNCLDVMEIDGASNNKVDNIRDLRETVQYAPTHGRKYKIYIIDEVHMLSSAAWNALLKTLEEPPAHVKFFFATTEAHKVLPTITSRCQRFDLRRISVPVIVARLKEIATHEGIVIEASALPVIARAADGGMRDAQSILDQMIAFCGGENEASPITEADVIDVFGLASKDEIGAVIGALIEGDGKEVISVVNELESKGRNLERFYGDLVVTLRDILVFHHLGGDSGAADLSVSEAEELRALAQRCRSDLTQRLIEELLSFDGALRNAPNKLVFIEVTLLRVMKAAHATTIDDLIRRLQDHQRAAGSSTVPESPQPVTPAPPARHMQPHRSVAAEATSGARMSPSSGPPPRAAAPEPEKTSRTDENLTLLAESSSRYDPAPTNVDTTSATTGGHPPRPARKDSTSVAPAHTPPPFTPPTQDAAVDALDEANRLWRQLIVETGKIPGKRALQLHMKEARPLAYENGILSVGLSDDFPEDHFREFAHHDANRFLTAILAKVTSTTDVALKVERISEDFSQAQTVKPRRLISSREVWEAVESSEFVQSICKLFEGEIVDVRG